MEMVKPGNCRQELQQGNTVALSVYRGEFSQPSLTTTELD